MGKVTWLLILAMLLPMSAHADIYCYKVFDHEYCEDDKRQLEWVCYELYDQTICEEREM